MLLAASTTAKLMSRNLSVAVTGEAGQAVAVELGGVWEPREKRTSNRGRLEGPESIRLGNQIYSLGS